MRTGIFIMALLWLGLTMVEVGMPSPTKDSVCDFGLFAIWTAFALAAIEKQAVTA